MIWYAYLAEDTNNNCIYARIISEDGTLVLDRLDSQTVDELKVLLAEFVKENSPPSGVEAKFVYDPTQHTGVQQALSLLEQNGDAKAVDDLVDTNALVEAYEANHLCLRCFHRDVCGMEHAAKQKPDMLVTITACQAFFEIPGDDLL